MHNGRKVSRYPDPEILGRKLSNNYLPVQLLGKYKDISLSLAATGWQKTVTYESLPSGCPFKSNAN